MQLYHPESVFARVGKFKGVDSTGGQILLVPAVLLTSGNQDISAVDSQSSNTCVQENTINNKF